MTTEKKTKKAAPKKAKKESLWKSVGLTRDTYKELQRVSVTTGVPMRDLGNFWAALALAACADGIQPRALEVPEGLTLPKTKQFTVRNEQPINISAHLHAQLKKISDPLNASVNLLLEASWPSLRKTFRGLPNKRWGSGVTMVNNAVNAALKRNRLFMEEKVAAEMAGE